MHVVSRGQRVHFVVGRQCQEFSDTRKFEFLVRLIAQYTSMIHGEAFFARSTDEADVRVDDEDREIRPLKRTSEPTREWVGPDNHKAIRVPLGEAETERALRQAARAAAAHDWALVVWVVFCLVVVGSYVLWGEALVRYLLAVAPV